MRVETFDGLNVAPSGFSFPAGSPAGMFGQQVFTRMRARMGDDNKVRIFGLLVHLQRTSVGVQKYFGISSRDAAGFIQTWKGWVISAVRAYYRTAGAHLDHCYIHLGCGRMQAAGAMLQAGQGELNTYIAVEAQPPLYGEGLYVSPERTPDIVRPTGPLCMVKLSGMYAELAYLKNQARRRISQAGISVPTTYGVETLLFDARGYAVEFGCANLALLVKNTLVFPKGICFPGITQGAVRSLAEQHGLTVMDDHITPRMIKRGTPIAMGTAVYRGLVPVVWYNGARVPDSPHIATLQQAYMRLWKGESPRSTNWVEVVSM